MDAFRTMTLTPHGAGSYTGVVFGVVDSFGWLLVESPDTMEEMVERRVDEDWFESRRLLLRRRCRRLLGTLGKRLSRLRRSSGTPSVPS